MEPDKWRSKMRTEPLLIFVAKVIVEICVVGAILAFMFIVFGK